MEFASPSEGGAAMTVAHFSSAGVTPAAEASAVLDPEDAAMSSQVLAALESKARGLDTRLQRTVAPAITRGLNMQRHLQDAARLLLAWQGEM